MEIYKSFSRRFFSYVASYSVVLVMFTLVLIVLLGTIIYKSIIRILLDNEIPQFASILTTITSACLNVIAICILSYFYSWIAVKLTDFENHRLDSEYESALTFKMYLFQFANFYGSIFYIGFIKGR